MSRVAIAKNVCALNTTKTLTRTAISTANNHSLDLQGVKDEKITLFLEHTNSDDVTITIKAGAGVLSDNGDLVFKSEAAGIHAWDLESARFKGRDGKVNIDLAAASGDTPTGNIFTVIKS
jgi:hypothetical protein